MKTMQSRVRPSAISRLALLVIALVLLGTASATAPAGATGPAQSSSFIYLPFLAGAPGPARPDSGFRPAAHGFSFENYGGDQGYTNLTPAELLRMFGAGVCAGPVANGSCPLTPQAEQWMDRQNQSMNGGHCEGFAVLSLLFYDRQLNVQEFGAPTVPQLQIQNNQRLQREIAYWFVTQATQPAQSTWVQGTPNEIVAALRASYLSGKAAEYVIGFYKRDRTGGHAVTPIALEDRENGVTAILIYDNNYPGVAREILVDTARNSWSYQGSTNPAVPADEYEGDAATRTLELAPIAPRVQQQVCSFCEASSTNLETQQQATRFNEVYLDGDADLLITEDQSGRAVGFRNGQPVNEIPGATARSSKFLMPVWANDDEPVYRLPTTVDFKISIDGRRLSGPSSSAVTMIGPGYVLEVNDITLEAGQVDELDVSANGTQLAYRTATGETPDILLGFETPAADYSLVIKGFDLTADDQVFATIDEANGEVRLDAATDGAVAFDLLLERVDGAGTQVFATGEDVQIGAADLLYVNYGAWQGDGQPLALEIDRGADGTIDETVQLVDAGDLFAE